MARPKGREPRIEIRRHTSKRGVVREVAAVRYYDHHGVRRRVTFKTLAEAEIERARIALEGAPADVAAGVGTVGEFWPAWLADARGRLQESTVEMHEYYWAREIEPRWGEVAFRDITPRAVAQWRGVMVDAGIGVESIRKTMVLLQAIIRVAIEWGEASENPLTLVRKPPPNRRRAITVIEPEIVERLRAEFIVAEDQFSATLMAVLAYTGMRPGEALALQRRHIRRDTILVEQAVARGKIKVQKTGRAYRTVDLLDPLRDDVAAWIEAAGVSNDLEAPLFPRPDGDWFTKDDWDNWRERRFHRRTKAIGLGTPRPYDLRHSFASLLIREQRASIVDIADQLGHAPTETLNTYSHVVREYRRQKPLDAVEAISAARRGIAVNAVRDVAVGVASDALERTGMDSPTRTGEG